MIVSNEPGYYREGFSSIGHPGVYFMPSEAGLGFGALPGLSAIRMLDTTLMDDKEIEWLNTYHRRVAATIGPLLQGSDHDWLMQATTIISA